LPSASALIVHTLVAKAPARIKLTVFSICPSHMALMCHNDAPLSSPIGESRCGILGD
jgi:hypothetical protein